MKTEKKDKIASDFIKALGWFDGRLCWSNQHDGFILTSATYPYEAAERYNEFFRVYKAGIQAGKLENV